MKRPLLASGFLTISLIWASPVAAAGFSEIYAFGDSLSDNGNVFAATGMGFPPAPYAQGRFSNGPVWSENLAESLGVELDDFAFGGATTGDRNTLDGIFPGLLGLEQQIDNFIATNPTAAPNALYALWAGSNDYLPTETSTFMPFDTPNVTLSNLQMAVNDLAEIGARKFAVLNLPNLGEIPRTSASLDGFCPPDTQFDADCLNDLTAAHNAGLSSLFSSFPPGVEITLVDVNSLFANALVNPEQFGFTNVTEPCFNQITGSVCGNSNEYLFWDTQHPTSEGHRLIGQLAFRVLTVPEPTSTLGLLSLGTLGALFSFLRKKKNQQE